MINITDTEYDRLLRVDFDSPRDTEAAIPLIVALVAALRAAYVTHAGTVNGRGGEVKVTDTLATKILRFCSAPSVARRRMTHIS